TGFLELNERELSEMMQLAQKTIRVLQRVFFAEGFNWTLQEGISAGQTIEHLHMHIMPRKTGDFNNPGDWYPELKRKYYDQIDSEARPKFDINELKKITAFLREISTEAD
ncbi:MAG: HIT domain-containing protein, partial [Bacteroidales bacterium]|nr:HIT domain-containing protein [Bacteroidales bacterium]